MDEIEKKARWIREIIKIARENDSAFLKESYANRKFPGQHLTFDFGELGKVSEARWDKLSHKFSYQSLEKIIETLRFEAAHEELGGNPSGNVIARRFQDLVGQKVTGVAYGVHGYYDDWEYMEKFPHEANLGVILDIKGAFAAHILSRPDSYSPTGDQVSLFRRPRFEIIAEIPEGCCDVGAHCHPVWEQAIGQRISAVYPELIPNSGVEFFEEENLWWDPDAEKLEEECPAYLGYISIEFENGVRFWMAPGGTTKGGIIIPGSSVMVFFSQEEAEHYGYGRPFVERPRTVWKFE